MKRAIGWMLSSLMVLAIGCPDEGTDCTLEARVSVSVTLTAEGGGAVPEATVTWETADQGPEACEYHGAEVWLCGWEVGGEMLITAEAEGFQNAEETVTVPEDECHVDSQSIDIELQPVDCTDEEVPSVLVFVVDGGGSLIPDATVEYAPRDELWTAPEPCEPMGGGSGFVCGYEMDGIIDLWAEAPDFVSAIGEVEVGADECHVITEEYTFELEPQD